MNRFFRQDNAQNRAKKFAKVSLLFGVLSLFNCCCLVFSVLAGYFGLLTINAVGQMSCWTAIWMARGGIALGLFSAVAWFFFGLIDLWILI